MMRRMGQFLSRMRERAKRLHRDTRAAAATEYILILTLVVLPLVALMPMFVKMIRLYAARSTSLTGLPFP